MSDGTQLSGGDIIATEDMPAGARRGEAALPTTAYKVPRGKTAVGNVDEDLGDAAAFNPLGVQIARERYLLETAALAKVQAAQNFAMAQERGARRSYTIDRRGSVGERGMVR